MDNNETYVSLDVGTSNVKIIIGEIVNGHLNIIGVGNVESSGLKGVIVDIDETVKSIQKVISEAEKMIGAQIKRIILGINANQIKLSKCKGVIAINSENREITNNDIERVIESAKSIAILPEREIIDVIPVQFIVDGFDEIKDPRGMIGVRLEMDGIMVTGVKTIIHNLLRCVERTGLEIIDICLQSLGSSEIALTKDEKNRGVALIDIGGGSTNIIAFQDGELKLATMIPIGGEHITKDISIVLHTPRDNAEQIKIKYGHAFCEKSLEEVMFDVPNMSKNNNEQCSQLELSEIIEARLEEILQLIREELNKSGVNQLSAGYVLTGGIMKMPGILDIAHTTLKGNVRIYSPNYIGVRDPQFTSGIGLIKYANKKMKLSGNEYIDSIQENQHLNHQSDYNRLAIKKTKQKDSDYSVGNKVKQFFRYLWE